MESLARKIVRTLQQAGHVAYYAGGCVRDELRGVEPKDYDIATDATPQQVRSLFKRTHEVGAHFGVISVLDQGAEFQVATFRADGEYVDGRHPAQVTFTSAEEDARRRDFTINGMFKDPITGKVIDYVGGREDLKRGVLRAIGDASERFHEDRLRLLRAVRFATTLELEIEPSTWQAVRTHAHALGQVSAERIREELLRILQSPHRVRGLDLLESSGLLTMTLPEVAALRGCEQPPQWHPEGDVYVHTRIMLDLLAADAPNETVWAVLLHDIGKPPTYSVDATGRIRFSGHDQVGARMAEKILERLKFSRAFTEAVVEMVAMHMVFKDVRQMRVAKLKRFMARKTFPLELELHRVDCQSSHGELDNLHFLVEKNEEFSREPIIPAPLVNGKDLIARGWQPGPYFGPVLEEVQTLQLEGALTSREDALRWLSARYPQPPTR